ncbi:MAG TPA: hypothetical protein VG164_08900 [Trebonia sp.]|jgi:hypothetical protein|nr:hypothetical protein [Trebonia sp.]
MMARDYVDVAALLRQYSVGQLIALAVERDPGLEDADFADAGQHLDQMQARRLRPLLASAGADGDDVSWLRRQFAGWPRDAARRLR